MSEHCEMWLEKKTGAKQFRIALLAPPDVEVLGIFKPAASQDSMPERRLYVSEWYDDIKGAEGDMNRTAIDLNEKDVKFLFFREIRQESM
jgi:hypothetical protein